MSDFKSKMHQNRFRLGLCPRPRWGAYDAPPDPLVGWEGIVAKGASILVPSALASVLPYHLYVRGAASVCVYCVNCTKFGQLILRIVIKIDATRCQIFRLKCTKIVSAWLRPRPHWGRLRRSPRPPSRLGRDRRLGRLHSRDFGTRLGFAVPSLCPWRRLCLRLLCKLHKIWSVDSQDNH